jgi:hypothetical protein
VDPEGYVEEGCVNGRLFIGATFGENRGHVYIGDFQRWMRQVSLSVGPFCGTWGRGGPSIGNVENLLKEGSGFGACLSMGALFGEPGEGAPSLGAFKVMKGRLWGRESLYIGAQLGNLERAYLQGNLRYG